jgi:hypothetical protein
MLDGDPPLLSKSSSPETVSKPQCSSEGHFCPLRWKLLIITSLVAALLSAGGCLLSIYWAVGANLDNPRRAITIAVYSIPLVFTTLAAVFVYRHTARRRKLQVLVSVLLSITLILAALCAVILSLDRLLPYRHWHN